MFNATGSSLPFTGNTRMYAAIILLNMHVKRAQLLISDELYNIPTIIQTNSQRMPSNRTSSPWLLWEIFMITSSNENILRVTDPMCGEFTGHRWIPSQKPVTRSFGVSFDLRLNNRLNKQSKCRWFETPSRSLCRHCNMLDKTGILRMIL